jgi:predicted Zn-dependent protease
MGVHILSVLLMFQFAGCATEYNLATGREESLMYGTEKEVKIGEAVAAQFNEHFEINTEVDVNERVETILDRITAVADRKDIIYHIKVIDEDEINAVSLPGGYIYVFKGLMDKVENDDQLASVIAHEVAHITARHGIKRLQAQYGYLALQALAISSGDPSLIRGTQAAFLTAFTEFSQDDEHEADRLAVRYMKRAGYDANEVAEMLRLLKREQDKRPAGQFVYWRTHPHIPRRIAVVNQEVAGELKFQDYLNITGDR